MARNSEKAMTTLARWHQMKLEEEKGGSRPERRPYLSTLCEDLPEAEKWRNQIIREIAKKVSQIQNAGLGEFKLRDLNDEINKCLREKGHWERRIRQLGGPDYAKHGPRMLDNEGKEVPGARGYKYFGAAKDLPGVRELFEPDMTSVSRRTRAELMRDVDADYYGYRDDDDGILEPLEAEAETNKSTNDSLIVKNYYINVPSQNEIKTAIINLKKKQMLETYIKKASV
jgi:pre-mRNA-splicing factor ISY1